MYKSQASTSAASVFSCEWDKAPLIPVIYLLPGSVPVSAPGSALDEPNNRLDRELWSETRHSVGKALPGRQPLFPCLWKPAVPLPAPFANVRR
jgi:hypothetical protein